MSAPLVRCDEVQWDLLGLSLASWNAVISLGLAALWLARGAARAGPTGAVAVGPASSIIEISTTQLRRTPVGSSVDLARASTATALTASEPPAPDSKQ